MNKTLLKLSSYSIFLLALMGKINATNDECSSRACGVSSNPEDGSGVCYIAGTFSTGGASTFGKVISSVGCNFTVTRLAADASNPNKNLYSVRFNQTFCDSISALVWQSKSTAPITPTKAIVKSVSACGFIVSADINSTVTFFAIPTT